MGIKLDGWQATVFMVVLLWLCASGLAFHAGLIFGWVRIL